MATLFEKIVAEVFDEYTLQHPDELMGYRYLSPDKTGVNVDIFVDDGEAYKRDGHKPLLFVRNGYEKTCFEFVPISISSTPHIMTSKIEVRISKNDIRKIYFFIRKNLPLLLRLANMDIDQVAFLKSISPVKSLINEEKGILNEMSLLRAADTNLPTDIWVDEGETFHGHAPRIKFRASNEQKTTWEFSAITLEQPPSIKNLPRKTSLKNKEIKRIEEFVNNNRELLIQLAYGEIDLEAFKENMVKPTTPA